jgi:hypothetical protein
LVMGEMQGATVQRIEHHCPECGNSMGCGARFCMHCGGSTYNTLMEQVTHRSIFPTVGGLLIIAGAAFNFVTAWYMNEITVDYGRYASLASAYYLTMVFTVLLGALGIVSLLGGLAALSRRDFTLAVAGGIASCFSVGATVGLAGLLIVAVSKDEFAQGSGPQSYAPGAGAQTMSASEQALSRKGG